MREQHLGGNFWELDVVPSPFHVQNEGIHVCVYSYTGFPGGTSRRRPACRCWGCKIHGFDPWFGKIPWRRARKPTPGFLTGGSHGQRCMRATVHRAVQSWTQLEWVSRHARTPICMQTEILIHIYICIFIYLFLAMSCNLWLPSFPTRDRIQAMAIKMPSLNHWTTRKFPMSLFCSSIHIFDTHCYCWFQFNSTVFVLIFFFSVSVSPFSNSKNKNKKTGSLVTSG